MPFETWLGEAVMWKSLLLAPFMARPRPPTDLHGRSGRAQGPPPIPLLEAPMPDEAKPDAEPVPETSREEPSPVRLKAPRTPGEAARLFAQHMFETGQTGGGIRSATVYWLYVDWSEEVDQRQAVRHERFLEELAKVPGVVKRQLPINGLKKRRWWFDGVEGAALSAGGRPAKRKAKARRKRRR